MTTLTIQGLPGGSDSKESACNVGDLGSIPELGRSPGGSHGHSLQYSCLENSHGQRSLGQKKSEMIEWLNTYTVDKKQVFFFSFLDRLLKSNLSLFRSRPIGKNKTKKLLSFEWKKHRFWFHQFIMVFYIKTHLLKLIFILSGPEHIQNFFLNTCPDFFFSLTKIFNFLCLC